MPNSGWACAYNPVHGIDVERSKPYRYLAWDNHSNGFRGEDTGRYSTAATGAAIVIDTNNLERQRGNVKCLPWGTSDEDKTRIFLAWRAWNETKSQFDPGTHATLSTVIPKASFPWKIMSSLPVTVQTTLRQITTL